MKRNTSGFIGLIALLVVFLVFLVFFFGLGKRGSDAPENTPSDTLGVGIYDTGIEAKQNAQDMKDLLEKKAAQTMEEGS